MGAIYRRSTPVDIRRSLLATTIKDPSTELVKPIAVCPTPEYAREIASALNSHAAMKEALIALLHEPMSERAVDRAKRALTLAEGTE